jgi:hypothetical protein
MPICLYVFLLIALQPIYTFLGEHHTASDSGCGVTAADWLVSLCGPNYRVTLKLDIYFFSTLVLQV